MTSYLALILSNKGNQLPMVKANSDTLQVLLNIVFATVGAIALLMVVIAGFRYVRGGSNETIVAEAKRQLAHALVGLVVVASAAMIVNFVLGRVG